MTNPLKVLPQEFVAALEKTGATISNLEPLSHLGQGNLPQLLKVLRNAEGSLRFSISRLHEKLNVFHRKTPAELVAITDFSVDVSVLNPGIKPDSPLRLGDRWYDYGHSTLLWCGSCKYASWKGGQKQCELLATFNPDQVAPAESPCVVRQMAIGELATLSRQYLKKIQTLKNQRDIVRKAITDLLPLIRTGIRYPTLPGSDDRRTVYAYGDRVRVFTFTPACRKKDRFRWHPATVISSESGCVNVCFDHPIMTARHKRRESGIVWTKHVWQFSDTRRTMLHEWEYQQIRDMFYNPNHHDPFYDTWCSNFRGESRLYDRLTDTTVKIERYRIINEHVDGRVINALPQEQRLLGAEEAAHILGFSDIPKKEADVVQAYRRLKNDVSVLPWLLERARSTLLLRIQKVTSWVD